MGSHWWIDHGGVSAPRRLDAICRMGTVCEHQIGLLSGPPIKPTEPRGCDIQHQTTKQPSGAKSVRRAAFASPPDWGVAVAHMLGPLARSPATNAELELTRRSQSGTHVERTASGIIGVRRRRSRPEAPGRCCSHEVVRGNVSKRASNDTPESTSVTMLSG